MKKVMYSMLALIAMATTAQAATDYGFYVGGVKVSSDNYTQIVQKSSDITSGTVTYSHSTKTLTLTDVKMSRSGDDKNGIDNYDCDGLKIVFKGTNELQCKDASVIQCKTNTIIECATGSNTELCYTGNSYRVIYLWGGNLTIQGNGVLNVIASGSGKGIEGKNATETLTINNIGLTIKSKNNCLRDIANVTFSGSSATTLGLYSSSSTDKRVNNVKAMTFNGKQHIDDPEDAIFDATKYTITTKNGTAITDQTIVINDDVILLDQANEKIPDANFRNALREIYQKDYLMKSEAKNEIVLNVSNKGIASLKGIEYFTNLENLICDKNNLTTLDLSANTKIHGLNCSANQLTNLDVSVHKSLGSLDCSNNKLTSIDVTNNSELQNFHCSNNQLGTLDITKNKKMGYLYCDNNKLTSIELDVNNMCFLKLYCYSNRIKDQLMQKLVEKIPLKTAISDCHFVPINSADPNEQNVITTYQVDIVKIREYKVYDNAFWGEDYPGLASSTGLSFSATTATATLGEPFTAPTLNNPNSKWISGIIYSSSNPKVATVNSSTGAVTLVGGGTAKITASYEGRPHYFPADNVSYSLTVSGSTGIETVTNELMTDDCWYSLDGRKLQGEPTQKGIYIYKGRKIRK